MQTNNILCTCVQTLRCYIQRSPSISWIAMERHLSGHWRRRWWAGSRLMEPRSSSKISSYPWPQRSFTKSSMASLCPCSRMLSYCQVSQLIVAQARPLPSAAFSAFGINTHTEGGSARLPIMISIMGSNIYTLVSVHGHAHGATSSSLGVRFMKPRSYILFWLTLCAHAQ